MVLRFRVLGFRTQGFGFRVLGLQGFRALWFYGSGFWDLGFRV